MCQFPFYYGKQQWKTFDAPLAARTQQQHKIWQSLLRSRGLKGRLPRYIERAIKAIVKSNAAANAATT